MIDGKRLRELRKSESLTQAELASKTGIAKATIERYERQEQHASVDYLINLARFFSVTTDYLLGLSSEPAPNAPHDLTPDEQALLDAYRQGDKVKATQLVVADHDQ